MNIKEVKTEDKEFAGCNTPNCPYGAEFELWINDSRKDARCKDCAIEMNWFREDPVLDDSADTMPTPNSQEGRY